MSVPLGMESPREYFFGSGCFALCVHGIHPHWHMPGISSFTAAECPADWMYHSLFTRSSVCAHLGCFQSFLVFFLAVTDNATTGIFVSVWMCVCVSLG